MIRDGDPRHFSVETRTGRYSELWCNQQSALAVQWLAKQILLQWGQMRSSHPNTGEAALSFLSGGPQPATGNPVIITDPDPQPRHQRTAFGRREKLELIQQLASPECWRAPHDDASLFNGYSFPLLDANDPFADEKGDFIWNFLFDAGLNHNENPVNALMQDSVLARRPVQEEDGRGVFGEFHWRSYPSGILHIQCRPHSHAVIREAAEQLLSLARDGVVDSAYSGLYDIAAEHQLINQRRQLPPER